MIGKGKSMGKACQQFGNSDRQAALDKAELLQNLDKLHTTELGAVRIQKNLSLNTDDVISLLNTLILQETESPEISFDLQVAGDESVPDAVISQKSFKIVVETKLYNQFDKRQLLNHLEQFGAEDIKILLTIDPKPMKQQLFDEKLIPDSHKWMRAIVAGTTFQDNNWTLQGQKYSRCW